MTSSARRYQGRPTRSPGLASYEALREYSIEFQGGQTNMFIVDAEMRGELNGTAPIRDLPSWMQ